MPLTRQQSIAGRQINRWINSQRYRSDFRRRISIRNQLQQRRRNLASLSIQNVILDYILRSRMTTFTRKPISLWSKTGLDLTDSSFAKAYHSELKHNTDLIPLYDLNRTKWETYRVHLEEKANRTCMRTLLTVERIDKSKEHDLLKEYSQITEEMMKANAADRWPATDPTFSSQEDCDKHVDAQLKADLLGKYLMSSITSNAKREIRSFRDDYEFTVNGEVHIDGPSYLWFLAHRVDPDNGQLVSEHKTTVRSLHIKNFGYSAITMMAEFKNLYDQVKDLAGDYSDDELYHDVWTSLLTIHEPEFKRYVKRERDDWWKKPRGSRDSLTKLIKTISAKEISMKADEEWNRMSEQDSQILALVTHVESMSKVKVPLNQCLPLGNASVFMNIRNGNLLHLKMTNQKKK